MVTFSEVKTQGSKAVEWYENIKFNTSPSSIKLETKWESANGERLNDILMRLAETDAEIADATADTARLFGPFLVGVPLVFIYVSVVGAFVYGVVALTRRKAVPRS